MATGKPSEARTTIDSLTELLRERGKTELNKIADTLAVNPSIVENWVKVLEDASLVKVTYEVGKMYVEPMSTTVEQQHAIATTREEKKTALENAIAIQKAVLDKYSAQLEAVSSSVRVSQRVFQEKFPDLERQLDGINKIYLALQDEGSKIDGISKKADSVYQDINKRISALYEKIEGAETANVEKARGDVSNMQDTLKKAKELEGQLDLLSKSKDKALSAIRSSIEEQLKSLEKELNVAESNIGDQLKAHRAELAESVKSIQRQANAINDLIRQVNSFKKDKESVKRALMETKANFNDEYSKLSSRMGSTGGVLRQQIAAMLVELDGVKASFGEASKFYDEARESKIDIEEAQKEIAKLRDEANTLAERARSAAGGKGTEDAKERALQEAKQEIKSLSANVSKLQSEIDRISKKGKKKK